MRAAIAADEITLKAENAAENASATQPAAEPENTQRAGDLSAPDDAGRAGAERTCEPALRKDLLHVCIWEVECQGGTSLAICADKLFLG